MAKFFTQRFKKRIRILLKGIFIFISILFLLLILSAVLINYFYKDKIIQFTVNELNKQLIVPVNIHNIDFEFWKTFPNASVEFDDVIIKSANTNLFITENNFSNDTLLKAEKIYLQLNPLDLLTGNYNIKLLKIYNGYIKLYVDNSGVTNFNILKKPITPKISGHENFNFDNVLFKNIKFEYTNKQVEVQCIGNADKLKVIGDIRKDSAILRIDASLFISNFDVGGNTYIANKHLNILSRINILNNLYQFYLSKFALEGVNFSGNGYYQTNPYSFIKFEAYGTKLNISKLINLLPDKVINKLNYKSKGTISLKYSINGPVGKGKYPAVTLKFNVYKAALIEKTNNIELYNINLQGEYNNFNNKPGNSDMLNLSSFSAKLGNGNLNGNIVLRNLNEPLVYLTIYNKLNLSDIKSFFNIDAIEILKGRVECNISVSGKLPFKSSYLISDFANLNYSGSVNITDGFFKIKNLEYNFGNINGELKLQHDILFNNLSFTLHGNDFHINGTLFNGIPFFLCTDQKANLIADISSNNLDMSNYFEKSPENNSANPSFSRQLLFPENLSLDVKLSISNFKLHKFNAKWVSCNINYKPTIFTVKSVYFESMSGNISGNGLIVQDIDKNFITKSQLDLSNVDIHLLFAAFNNFTQNIITYNNLSGKLNGTLFVSSQWDNNFILDKDKLFADGDINIADGQLIDFIYAKALSKFISMDELKTINFKTLKNRIAVKDNKVNIPQMDIYSSAFNIKVSGIHNFDNHYTYKVKILLSDILWGKAKRHKKENEEFGIVEDDGLGKTTIPLSIVGYNSDYKISYDTKEAFNMFKSTLSNQRIEIKQALNNEFGWYKNDSTLKHKNDSKKQHLRVSWDDDNSNSVTSPSNSTTKNKKDKKDDDIKVEWPDN